MVTGIGPSLHVLVSLLNSLPNTAVSMTGNMAT